MAQTWYLWLMRWLISDLCSCVCLCVCVCQTGAVSMEFGYADNDSNRQCIQTQMFKISQYIPVLFVIKLKLSEVWAVIEWIEGLSMLKYCARTWYVCQICRYSHPMTSKYVWVAQMQASSTNRCAAAANKSPESAAYWRAHTTIAARFFVTSLGHVSWICCCYSR